MQSLNWRGWCAMLLATGVLAGCSSGGDDDNDEAPPPQPPVTDPEGPRVDKVLFIGVDGLTYDAMRRGVADKTLPNIGKLNATRAWTGGVTGSTTQQPTLPAPGWATLLTGQWADQHGIRFNGSEEAIASPTLFERVKGANPEARTAAAFNSTSLASLLNADRDAGHLQALTDCGGQDDCVAAQTRDRINEGYDVVVAQFGAPAQVAAEIGFGSSYDASLHQADATIGALTQQLVARQADYPNENWMVVLTSSYGLNKTGAIDGRPQSPNKTIVIASNQPHLLGESADDVSFDGVWDNNWYALPSAADVMPTVLDRLGALPAADTYDLAGTSLLKSLAVRRTTARTATDNKSVTLTWVRVGAPAEEVVVSRDGVEIARLPGTANEYVDTELSFDDEGVHTLTYTVATGDVISAAHTKVTYVKPPVLLDSLRSGLTMLFPFEGNITDVAAGGGSITSFNGTQDPAYGDPGVYGKMFKSERQAGPQGGFKWNYPAGMLKSASAFTIGFWFQSDGSVNDLSIVGNKDYNSGGNPGLTIAQWSGPVLYFNLAGGGSRVDINYLKFTPNKPVYIAMTIDKAAKTMTAWVYDSELGFKTQTISTGAVNLDQVEGIYGPHLGLNEDGTGRYHVGRAPYTMYYDDLAYWSRALTEAEVRSLALSGKSVSELFP